MLQSQTNSTNTLCQFIYISTNLNRSPADSPSHPGLMMPPEAIKIEQQPHPPPLQVSFFLMSPTFKFSRQKVDTKFLENGTFQSIPSIKHWFLTISKRQNFAFNQVQQVEMSILKKSHFILTGKFKCG